MSHDRVVERVEVCPGGVVYEEHLARYRFAATWVKAGRTLDIGCGSGYGSDFLSQGPNARVIGVDLHFPSLSKARREYPDHRIGFVAATGVALPFPDACFQNVVTLETIEHVADDHGFLRELTRVLTPAGTCVVSTPNVAYSVSHKIKNPYHVREYAVGELLALLSPYFGEIDTFYQGFSSRHHEEVGVYGQAIQGRKRTLHPGLRFAIDNLYRPVKQVVPRQITGWFIGRLLGLSYPQPRLSDITIAAEPMEDFSVCIAVCRHPRSP